MSTIGPGTLGALNLAGSLAGTQQTHAHTDRAREEGTQRAFQIDRQKMSAHNLDDVAETGLSRDRDADGRLPYDRQSADETAEDTGDSGDAVSVSQPRPTRTPDVFGERGLTLDLEA